MSREIKFRAQRSDNKEFVYGFYYKGKRADQAALDTPLGFARLFSSIITEEGVIFDVLERTVGQFTGLKDINGCLIYEGDIVKCRGLLTWETVMVKDIRKIPVQVSTWPTIYGPGNGECEVIGNIHENPNLLK